MDLASEKSANELLEEESRTLRQQLDQLREELVESTTKNGSNSSELQSVQAKVDSLTRDNDHLHETLDCRDQVLKQRDVELREARLKIEELLSMLNHTRAKADKHVTEGSVLSFDLEAAERKISALEEELAALALSSNTEEAMERLRNLNAGLEAKIKAQTETLNTLLSDHSVLGEGHASLRGELIHLQDTSAHELESLNKLVDETLHALMAEKCANDILLEEEKSMQTNSKALQSQIHNYIDQLTVVNSEITHLTEDKEELVRENCALRESLKDMQTMLNDHGTNSAESQIALAKMSSQISKLEEELRRAEATLVDKEAELEGSYIKNKGLEEEIMDLKDNLAIQCNDLKLNKRQLDELKARLESSNDCIGQLQRENTALRAEIEECVRREHGLLEEVSTFIRINNLYSAARIYFL